MTTQHTPEEQVTLKVLRDDLSLGIKIQQELAQPNSPLSRLYDDAVKAAMQNAAGIIHADLTTEKGIAEAKQCQAAVQRYIELAEWIANALHISDDAEQLLAEEDQHTMQQILEDEDKNDIKGHHDGV